MKRIKKLIKRILYSFPILKEYPYFQKTYRGTQCGLLKYLRYQLCPYFKNHIYFPIHKNSTVMGHNIFIGKNCKVGQWGGCYIQGIGKIYIGDYVQMALNTVILSANHNSLEQSIHIKKETIIGDYCWVAANACVMPGVILGPRTIVGAGSVVTKSFPDGYCVIAGNPAKLIKTIPKEDFIVPKDDVEFYGYIRSDKFPKYFKKHLAYLKFDYDISKVSNNEFYTK